MTHEEFVADWKNRYEKGTCTKDHLFGLQKIGRLTDDEVQDIINSKEVI